jgi:excisionase family DNA binding protein
LHANRNPSTVWLSVQELADRYGVSTKTIRRLIERGELPASTLRGTRVLRINAAVADALMERVPAAGQ